MFFRLPNLHPVEGRRSVSTLLLVVVAISGMAFSVPRSVVKDRSIPFPCMDSKCSCRDAAMCWDECGCLSTEQKIAWAERHGVTPPAWFKASRFAVASKATTGGCCAAKKSCCSRPAVATRQYCQGDQTGRSSSCAAGDCGEAEAEGVGIGRRRCPGIERLYLLLRLVTPVPPTPNPSYPLIVDRLGPIASVSFLGLAPTLVERPPEPATV